MNPNITIGPLSIPAAIALMIGSGLLGHLLLFMKLKGDKDKFSQYTDLFMTLILMYIVIWRLSLVLTNSSTVISQFSAILYLPGSIKNHVIAGGVSLLYGGYKIYRRGKSYLLPTLFLISMTVLPYFGYQTFKPIPQAQISNETIMIEDMKGNRLPLDLTGKSVSIVNFWASWCPPCRAEFPEIIKFYEEYKEEDMNLIVLNATSTEASLDAVFAFTKGMDLPIYLDSRGTASRTYNVQSLPSTLIFDKEGRLIEYKTGAVDAAWLASFLD